MLATMLKMIDFGIMTLKEMFSKMSKGELLFFIIGHSILPIAFFSLALFGKYIAH